MCYFVGLETFAMRDHYQDIQREVSRLRLEKACGISANRRRAAPSPSSSGG